MMVLMATVYGTFILTNLSVVMLKYPKTCTFKICEVKYKRAIHKEAYSFKMEGPTQCHLILLKMHLIETIHVIENRLLA